MDGSTELHQLAHLLRAGADTARDIASLRTTDREAIERLAQQMEAVAAKFDVIINGSHDMRQDSRGRLDA